MIVDTSEFDNNLFVGFDQSTTILTILNRDIKSASDYLRFIDSKTDNAESYYSDISCPYLKTHKITFSISPYWKKFIAIPPSKFLFSILKDRGYEVDLILPNKNKVRRSSTSKQVLDYDNELVNAVRSNDLDNLKKLQSYGRSMTACNKFSESIIHLACRRSDLEIIKFIVDHGGNINIVDDYGRNPLHDACWRSEPRFDIVSLLIDKNWNLLRVLDVRGATPLDYVREEHWIEWCAFIYYCKDKYWPIK